MTAPTQSTLRSVMAPLGTEGTLSDARAAAPGLSAPAPRPRRSGTPEQVCHRNRVVTRRARRSVGVDRRRRRLGRGRLREGVHHRPVLVVALD